MFNDMIPDAVQHPNPLLVLDSKQFLAHPIPPRKMLVDPIIPEQSISMLYAQRGIGKTNVALTLGITLATGNSMFGGRWIAAEARKVLYIDGEMQASVLQGRLTRIQKAFDTTLDLENLYILTPDIQPCGVPMPNLATPEGQQAIEPFLAGVALVIVDNISCLCRGGRENDAESWAPLQEWSLDLRKRNISVLFVHHSNKTGSQRGSNKKEDLMDTVIALKQPKNYAPTDAVRCEVHYEKARGFYGDQATPFEIRLQDCEGGMMWVASDLVDERAGNIMDLHSQGLSQHKIAKQTGINVAIVNRVVKSERQKQLL